MERRLLSGNEAIAYGAAHSGVRLAAAYPGTPSTEILETLAGFPHIYSEWSSNEAVAVEVALGASYTGARSLAAMKHVGLNVAADAFMAASTTGIIGGMVFISADDPGIHSSQNEQDSRNYARLGKIPCLDPSDSQEAYDFCRAAFAVSEEFDTPVLLRPTTRVCHSKSIVKQSGSEDIAPPAGFRHDPSKFVMLPGAARGRWPELIERLNRLSVFAETTALNYVVQGSPKIGVISSGISFQYARETFPEASFLKLGLSYPLPKKLIRRFADSVEKLVVIEELDDFLELHIRAMGIEVIGKDVFPRSGEFSPDVIRDNAFKAGLIHKSSMRQLPVDGLARRPPLLCPGCPHSGVFFTLSSIGQRSVLPGKKKRPTKLTICGDIGCYTLGAYPPLSGIDTCGCMGAGISQAAGMAKSGAVEKPLAIIGDSTFMHSGINGLLNAVYNQSNIAILILDNGTTAMTGHQGHPGSGVSVRKEPVTRVMVEDLARGAGVKKIAVVDAFNLKAIRPAIRQALSSDELEVIVIRGDCPTLTKKRTEPSWLSIEKCDDCGACLLIGCSAIKRGQDNRLFIDSEVCVGGVCGLCTQVCPKGAIAGKELSA